MLLKRIITGLVFLAFFLASVNVSWLWWILPALVVASALLGMYEFHTMSSRHHAPTAFIISSIIALLICSDAWWGGLAHLLPIISLGVCILLVHCALFGGIERAIIRAGTTFLAPFYIAFPLAIALMMIKNGLLQSGPGIGLLVFVVAVTWSTDTGAYFVGCNFGRRKLTPILSPNKTVEGSIGGVAAAIIAALLLIISWKMLRIVIPWYHAIVLSFLIAVLGQVGDLAESAFKRSVEVKDSGSFIIGHGGVLDVSDSLMISFPLSYLYFHYIVHVM